MRSKYIFLGVLTILVIVSAFHFLRPVAKTENTSQQPPLVSPTPDQKPVVTETTNSRTITYRDLGIRFTIAKQFDVTNNYTVSFKREGDKVYIYQSATPAEQGQWIQVFSKDPNITLSDAVKKQFLTGYDENTCFIKNISNDPQMKEQSVRYDAVEIGFPIPTDETSAPWWVGAEKCPKVYTTTNGLSYFVMDKNHPDRFAYLSIGQYAIPSQTGKPTTPWQNTLEFLPH